MLEELLSSAVEMALSVEEKEALLSRGGDKEECIVIYGKPKEAKERRNWGW